MYLQGFNFFEKKRMIAGNQKCTTRSYRASLPPYKLPSRACLQVHLDSADWHAMHRTISRGDWVVVVDAPLTGRAASDGGGNRLRHFPASGRAGVVALRACTVPRDPGQWRELLVSHVLRPLMILQICLSTSTTEIYCGSCPIVPPFPSTMRSVAINYFYVHVLFRHEIFLHIPVEFLFSSRRCMMYFRRSCVQLSTS